MMNWKGSGLSRNLPGGTQENHERPQSGYPVSWPRFEPRTPPGYECRALPLRQPAPEEIRVAEETQQWRALVSTAMNHPVHEQMSDCQLT